MGYTIISHVQKHLTTASTAQTEPLSLVDTEKVYGRGKDAHYEGEIELATLASRLKHERKAIIVAPRSNQLS